MRKIVLLGSLIISILLTGSSVILPAEGNDAVKQWWKSVQASGGSEGWTAASKDDFQITGIMQGKVNQQSVLKYDEVWCGSFSPALVRTLGTNSNSYDYVSKNFCIARQGDSWGMAVYPNSNSTMPFEEDFQFYGCTDWVKEYDMSDADMRNGNSTLSPDTQDSCESCS
jgi:hypothetical protein